MNFLLDTHAFLWWIDDSDELSQEARETFIRAENTIFVSAAISWEIAIKMRLGRLEIVGDPERFFPEQIVRNAFMVLPIQISHALHSYHLPEFHRDPFDRMLISQSQIEGLPIITKDPVFDQYKVETVW